MPCFARYALGLTDKVYNFFSHLMMKSPLLVCVRVAACVILSEIFVRVDGAHGERSHGRPRRTHRPSTTEEQHEQVSAEMVVNTTTPHAYELLPFQLGFNESFNNPGFKPGIALCKREEIDPFHLGDHDDGDSLFHKLRAGSFPDDTCQNNGGLAFYGLCQCDTNVTFSCGEGTTLWPPDGAMVTCRCVDGVQPGWSEPPRCLGCHKIEQTRNDDARIFRYPSSTCDQNHCECGSYVEVTCDSTQQHLSGSDSMTCACNSVNDAYWNFSKGSQPRCITNDDGPFPNPLDSTDDDDSKPRPEKIGSGIIIVSIAVPLLFVLGVLAIAAVYFNKRASQLHHRQRSQPPPAYALEPMYATIDDDPTYMATTGKTLPDLMSYPRQTSDMSVRYVTTGQSPLASESAAATAAAAAGDNKDNPYFTLEKDVEPEPVTSREDAESPYDSDVSDPDANAMNDIL